MAKEQLPVYQIQDFSSQPAQPGYFYLRSFAAHLQEHLFLQQPHRHNFYIVLLITQGTGTHTIDFQDYQVNPGKVFFLIPGQVHQWNLAQDTDGFILFFTSEYYQQQYPQKKLRAYPFFNALLQQPYLQVPEDLQAVLINMMRAMAAEASGGEWMHADMVRLYLDMLLIRLSRAYQHLGVNGQEARGILPQLQSLEDLVDQHFKEHLPVSFYADQLHLTPKQLNEICKRSLNKTPNALIQDRLLLEARRLLVHADLTSSQIAAELGYQDINYFFRFFKKHLGITPEQFRVSQT